MIGVYVLADSTLRWLIVTLYIWKKSHQDPWFCWNACLHTSKCNLCMERGELFDLITSHVISNCFSSQAVAGEVNQRQSGDSLTTGRWVWLLGSKVLGVFQGNMAHGYIHVNIYKASQWNIRFQHWFSDLNLPELPVYSLNPIKVFFDMYQINAGRNT